MTCPGCVFLALLESACIDWLPLFCEFTVERIAGSRGVLDYPPRYIFPFGMRLDKSVDNSGGGGILPDSLITFGASLETELSD